VTLLASRLHRHPNLYRLALPSGAFLLSGILRCRCFGVMQLNVQIIFRFERGTAAIEKTGQQILFLKNPSVRRAYRLLKTEAE
jgi:hypothetical protein